MSVPASYFFPSSSSDEEDSNTTLSTQSSKSQKKQKSNKTVNRKNQSHTSFFFRIDEQDSEIVYCRICELNHFRTSKTPYPYTRKGENTSNMIAHLRDRHDITKSNYTEYLDNNKQVRHY